MEQMMNWWWLYQWQANDDNDRSWNNLRSNREHDVLSLYFDSQCFWLVSVNFDRNCPIQRVNFDIRISKVCILVSSSEYIHTFDFISRYLPQHHDLQVSMTPDDKTLSLIQTHLQLGDTFIYLLHLAK